VEEQWCAAYLCARGWTQLYVCEVSEAAVSRLVKNRNFS